MNLKNEVGFVDANELEKLNVEGLDVVFVRVADDDNLCDLVKIVEYYQKALPHITFCLLPQDMELFFGTRQAALMYVDKLRNGLLGDDGEI